MPGRAIAQCGRRNSAADVRTVSPRVRHANSSVAPRGPRRRCAASTNRIGRTHMSAEATRPTLDGTVPWPPELVARYTERGYLDPPVAGGVPVRRRRRRPHRDVPGRRPGTAHLRRADRPRRRCRRPPARARDTPRRPGGGAAAQLLGVRRADGGLLPAGRGPGDGPAGAPPTGDRRDRGADRGAGAGRTGRVEGLRPPGAGARGGRRRADPAARAGGRRGRRPDSVDLRQLCRPADDPAAARRRSTPPRPPARRVALFLLSGGTTGVPKLIARTHDDYGYMCDGPPSCAGWSRRPSTSRCCRSATATRWPGRACWARCWPAAGW